MGWEGFSRKDCMLSRKGCWPVMVPKCIAVPSGHCYIFRCLAGKWKRGPRSSARFFIKTCRERSALDSLSKNGLCCLGTLGLGHRKHKSIILAWCLQLGVLWEDQECSGNTMSLCTGLLGISLWNLSSSKDFKHWGAQAVVILHV